MHRWADEPGCFGRLGIKRSTVKILLKTKDDHWFLRDWFDHHAAMVGAANIIIFDHNSTDPAVLDFYRSLGPETVVFTHDKRIDDLHYTDRVPVLYDELRAHCEYFLFLDTDELLYVSNGDGVIDNHSLLSCLDGAFDEGADFACTMWLQSAIKARGRFILKDEIVFLHGIQWGKPIVRSASRLNGTINHNNQAAATSSRVAVKPHFFLLHLKNLIPEQRIAANIAKLVSFKRIPVGSDAQAALEIDIPDYPHRRYQEEIRWSLDHMQQPPQIGDGKIDSASIEPLNDTAKRFLQIFAHDMEKVLADAGIIKKQSVAH